MANMTAKDAKDYIKRVKDTFGVDFPSTSFLSGKKDTDNIVITDFFAQYEAAVKSSYMKNGHVNLTEFKKKGEAVFKGVNYPEHDTARTNLKSAWKTQDIAVRGRCHIDLASAGFDKKNRYLTDEAALRAYPFERSGKAIDAKMDSPKKDDIFRTWDKEKGVMVEQKVEKIARVYKKNYVLTQDGFVRGLTKEMRPDDKTPIIVGSKIDRLDVKARTRVGWNLRVLRKIKKEVPGFNPKISLPFKAGGKVFKYNITPDMTVSSVLEDVETIGLGVAGPKPGPTAPGSPFGTPTPAPTGPVPSHKIITGRAGISKERYEAFLPINRLHFNRLVSFVRLNGIEDKLPDDLREDINDKKFGGEGDKECSYVNLVKRLTKEIEKLLKADPSLPWKNAYKLMRDSYTKVADKINEAADSFLNLETGVNYQAQYLKINMGENETYKDQLNQVLQAKKDSKPGNNKVQELAKAKYKELTEDKNYKTNLEIAAKYTEKKRRLEVAYKDACTLRTDDKVKAFFRAFMDFQQYSNELDSNGVKKSIVAQRVIGNLKAIKLAYDIHPDNIPADAKKLLMIDRTYQKNATTRESITPAEEAKLKDTYDEYLRYVRVYTDALKAVGLPVTGRIDRATLTDAINNKFGALPPKDKRAARDRIIAADGALLIYVQEHSAEINKYESIFRGTDLALQSGHDRRIDVSGAYLLPGIDCDLVQGLITEIGENGSYLKEMGISLNEARNLKDTSTYDARTKNRYAQEYKREAER